MGRFAPLGVKLPLIWLSMAAGHLQPDPTADPVGSGEGNTCLASPLDVIVHLDASLTPT